MLGSSYGSTGPGSQPAQRQALAATFRASRHGRHRGGAEGPALTAGRAAPRGGGRAVAGRLPGAAGQRPPGEMVDRVVAAVTAPYNPAGAVLPAGAGRLSANRRGTTAIRARAMVELLMTALASTRSRATASMPNSRRAFPIRLQRARLKYGAWRRPGRGLPPGLAGHAGAGGRGLRPAPLGSTIRAAADRQRLAPTRFLAQLVRRVRAAARCRRVPWSYVEPDKEKATSPRAPMRACGPACCAEFMATRRRPGAGA